MISLSVEVKKDIRTFLTDRLVIETPMDVNEECTCGNSTENCECLDMQLTIACSEDGTQWSYQTGDNSYTGGAYSLPHWAVTWVHKDLPKEDIVDDIINQLEELLAS